MKKFYFYVKIGLKSEKRGGGVLKNRKNIAILFAAVNLGIIAVSIVYAVLFYLFPDIFACSFKETFHLYCPGCGGSRAVTRLLSFDIWGSFLAFPPLYFAIAAVAEIDFRMIVAIIKNEPRIITSYKPVLFIIFAAVLVLHFFIRNVLLVYGYDPIGDILSCAFIIFPL